MCTQLCGSCEGQLSNIALIIICIVLEALSNAGTYTFQVPIPSADKVSQRQKEAIL